MTRTINALRVLRYLQHHGHAESGELCGRFGLMPRTVRRIYRDLEQAGYRLDIQRDGRCTRVELR